MFNIDNIKDLTRQIIISTIIALLVLVGCFFYFIKYNTNIYNVNFQLVSKSYMIDLNDMSDRVNDLLDYEIRLKNLNNNNYVLGALKYSNKYKIWDYSTKEYKKITIALNEMNKLLNITIDKLVKKEEKNLKLREDLYYENLQKKLKNQNNENGSNDGKLYIYVKDKDIRNQIFQLKSKVVLLKTNPFSVKTTVSEFKKNSITFISKSMTIAFIFFILSNFIIFFITRIRHK